MTQKNKVSLIVLAVVVICGIVGVIIDRTSLAIEAAGYRPTRTATIPPTEFISPIDAMQLTQTAAPTNTSFPTWTPAPTSTPEKLAWTACTVFIDQQLKLSRSNAQEYNPNGVIKAGNDYLIDVYYAINNVTYTCMITRDPNGDFRLISLSKK